MANIAKENSLTDSLLDSYYLAIEYVKNNVAIVAGIVAVLIAVPLGLMFYSQYKDGQEQKASNLLRKVAPLYEQGAFDAAISGDTLRTAGLKKISEDYAGTLSGDVASLYLGNAYLQRNNIDSALVAYTRVSGSVDLVSASAIAGEGACYEAKKDYARAARLYQNAAGRAGNTAVIPVYLTDAARTFELSGSRDEALRIYERLKKDYPQSAGGKDADQAIGRLKH